MPLHSAIAKLSLSKIRYRNYYTIVASFQNCPFETRNSGELDKFVIGEKILRKILGGNFENFRIFFSLIHAECR